MKAIWEFPLAITDFQDLIVPEQMRPLSIQFQNGQAYLWAIVDPNAPKRSRIVRCFGTGHCFGPRAYEYLGTVIDDRFVWHFFLEPVA